MFLNHPLDGLLAFTTTALGIDAINHGLGILAAHQNAQLVMELARERIIWLNALSPLQQKIVIPLLESYAPNTPLADFKRLGREFRDDEYTIGAKILAELYLVGQLPSSLALTFLFSRARAEAIFNRIFYLE
jgi:hypothetical protein